MFYDVNEVETMNLIRLVFVGMGTIKSVSVSI